MSSVVVLTGTFDGELLLGGVSGVGDVYIKEEQERMCGLSVAVSLGKIMFVTG